LAVWGVRWRLVAKTLRQAVLVEDGREWGYSADCTMPRVWGGRAPC